MSGRPWERPGALGGAFQIFSGMKPTAHRLCWIKSKWDPQCEVSNSVAWYMSAVTQLSWWSQCAGPGLLPLLQAPERHINDQHKGNSQPGKIGCSISTLVHFTDMEVEQSMAKSHHSHEGGIVGQKRQVLRKISFHLRVNQTERKNAQMSSKCVCFVGAFRFTANDVIWAEVTSVCPYMHTQTFQPTRTHTLGVEWLMLGKRRGGSWNWGGRLG